MGQVCGYTDNDYSNPPFPNPYPRADFVQVNIAVGAGLWGKFVGTPITIIQTRPFPTHILGRVLYGDYRFVYGFNP
jgi:hypothetical protein